MKVAFATLGCKVNQYDTATIETAVVQQGGSVVAFGPGADVYVINTCAVTDRADAESRQLARRARRFNPCARVVLTGCFAQTNPAQAAALKEVDHVIGVGRLADVLRAIRGELAAAERALVANLRKTDDPPEIGAEVFAGQTRAFLKIQEGCDLFCTFCIVPFARGRSRSVQPRRVIAELERLAALGFQEVVLTGIHLGGYGEDLDPPLRLVDLIEMVAEVSSVPRIRLSSIDPPEVTPRLLEIIARNPKICPHLHMPVQAGSDDVLAAMRRRYDSALVRDLCAEIRRMLPDAGLGTDVIAGFPGETEANFRRGLELLEELPFTYFHVFPYSRRSGTTAAKLPGHLPRAVIHARAEALRRLGEKKRREFVRRALGSRVEVLLETTRDRSSGWMVGYARNYIRVLVDAPDALANRLVHVRVARALRDRAVGVLDSENSEDARTAEVG